MRKPVSPFRRTADWPRFRGCPTVAMALAPFEQGQPFEGEGIGEAALEYGSIGRPVSGCAATGKLPVDGWATKDPLLNEAWLDITRWASRNFRPDHTSDLAHNGIGVRLTVSSDRQCAPCRHPIVTKEGGQGTRASEWDRFGGFVDWVWAIIFGEILQLTAIPMVCSERSADGMVEIARCPVVVAFVREAAWVSR
jgi:hypothetical protein